MLLWTRTFEHPVQSLPALVDTHGGGIELLNSNVKEISANAARQASVFAAAVAGQMPDVETRHMPAAETGQKSVVETRRMWSIAAGHCNVLILCILSQQQKSLSRQTTQRRHLFCCKNRHLSCLKHNIEVLQISTVPIS